MRTRRADVPYIVFFIVVAAAATAAVLASGGNSAERPVVASSSWRGVLTSRPPVDVGQRVIVVLKTPPLAERVSAAGGVVTIAQEQAWTKVSLSAQKLLLARLSLQGVIVHPELRFTRVLDGFSAVVPPTVVPIVERDPDVDGVYPVRIAYPAEVGAGAGRAAPIGHQLESASVDGRGVTVAVVDTGVDANAPLLRGRVVPPIDVAGGGSAEHGTQMAAVIARVAPGAAILPIRVAGSFARSDQVIAGLERAVDPNGDGDAHDAVRIALVALSEPFVGFPDGPEARAVAGARDLGVLVVAPAGNDGPAGAAYGDVSAPGGAADALAVGALDTRVDVAEAHVAVRSGLDTLFDATTPLASDVAPARATSLPLSSPAGSLYTKDGGSVVAGSAALTADPRAAAEAGASAVLVTGLPAGALGSAVRVPVVSIPSRVAHAIRARLAAHAAVVVTLGEGREAANDGDGAVAPFSSTGLAYDGGVKPDLVAPGVGFPGLGTSLVDGTSVAAAVAAGDAAILAQARPALGPEAIDSLLVGSARPLAHDPVTAQGAGEIDVGAAAGSELAASPPTLALGTSIAPGRKIESAFTLTNLSRRDVHAAIGIRTQHEGAATIAFTVRPRRIALAPGRSVLVHVDALTASQAIGTGAADGAVVAAIDGGGTVRVPWVLAFAPPTDPLGPVTMSGRTLTVDAGSVATNGGVRRIVPLARLDVRLADLHGHDLGLLDRIRDVLPGRYMFRLTGLGPEGAALSHGRYIVVVVAYPADGSPPSRRLLGFALP